MNKQSFPYCPHGTYVGGCAIDYLCHACENGDEITPEERAAYNRAKQEWNDSSGEEQFWSLPAHVLDGGY